MIRRNEYKFPFTSWSENKVRFFIKNQKMQQKYSMRVVNSLYFDTEQLQLHQLGEEGIVPRNKVRLRWYGYGPFDLDNSTLEIKSAFYNHREKRSKKYNEINMEKDDIFSLMKKRIDNKVLKPSAIVKYKRFYYENSENIRITLDYGLQYQKATLAGNSICTSVQTYNEKYNVLELKGDSLSTSNIVLNSRINWSRFSKYSRAILELYP